MVDVGPVVVELVGGIVAVVLTELVVELACRSADPPDVQALKAMPKPASPRSPVLIPAR